ncbi:calponin-2 isoform X2 [Magallana gigas]|uniref:calponin-2 isoform X2 n=1 Tax=Magallana gigas TaxID=29159 RepID=UPI0009751755|nr:calponin-2 isoform X2 [Crassostrea gigas]|eukprot:XP_019929282.1 PREDICTED: calponin-2 isoform X2 [Crassostrea gigas]
MAERMKPMGMDRALSSKDSGGATSITDSTARLKHTSMQRTLSRTGSLHQDKRMGAKYDPQAEAEVRHWFKQLLNEDIGEGSMTVEKNLKDGILLIKLLQKLYDGTPNLPPECNNIKLKYNTSTAPFKQMENIELFLKGANAYGVPDNSLFQTVDLYEGRNMAMVIATILQVGTEAQRNSFNGPVIGSKPTEKHIVHFTEEQKRAGHGIIGLQAGTNKCASQKGMKIGAARHIADIKADDLDRAGQGIIGAQAGTNQYASQKGMKIGGVRHIADIRADEMSQEGQGIVGAQAGTNKFASQSGMSFGAVRHIADIRADTASQEGQGVIGLQSGSNKGASQSGMSFGGRRHVSDIRVDDMSQDSQGIVGGQSGTNKFANQSGMSFGAVRHIADIRADDLDQQGQGTVGLQSGSNKFASQSGMSFGSVRHVADIRADQYSQEGAGTIGLQYGSNQGASQAGMNFGKGRGVADIPIQDLAESMGYTQY